MSNEDGSFRLDMSYFNYATSLTMTNRKFDDLFGIDKLNIPRSDIPAITQASVERSRGLAG